MLRVLASLVLMSAATSAQAAVADDGAHANDWFGQAVAVDGEWAAVGAPGDNSAAFNAGAIYMYHRSGGEWALHSCLLPEESDGYTGLGGSLALSGDTLIAGAEPLKGGRHGSARIYVRTSAGWRPQALLELDAGVEDTFGTAVALYGDDAAVLNGRSIIDGSLVDGALHLYRRTGDEWREAGVLPADAGSHLALVGGTLALTHSLVDEVTLYRRDGETWVPTGVIAPAMAGAVTWDLDAIALSGDTLAIADDLRIMLFTRDGAWRLTDTLDIPDPNGKLGVQIGNPLALTADRLAYATLEYTEKTDSVHLFARTGAGWVADGELLAADASAGRQSSIDFFGSSLALAGDSLLIGAMFTDVGTIPDTGSVYAYRRAAAGDWNLTQRLVPGESPGGCDCRLAPPSAGLWLLLGLLAGRRRRTR